MAELVNIRPNEIACERWWAAAALHLFEVNSTANIAKEDQDFERLDIRAGGDHVHSHGDAKRGRETEFANEFFRLRRLSRDRVFGLVRDLLAKVVALFEHVTADVNDIFGVRIIFAKDQRLRDQRAVRGEVQ